MHHNLVREVSMLTITMKTKVPSIWLILLVSKNRLINVDVSKLINGIFEAEVIVAVFNLECKR